MKHISRKIKNIQRARTEIKHSNRGMKCNYENNYYGDQVCIVEAFKNPL